MKAQVAPTQPGARPQQLGSSPWPQPLASGRPKGPFSALHHQAQALAVLKSQVAKYSYEALKVEASSIQEQVVVALQEKCIPAGAQVPSRRHLAAISQSAPGAPPS